MLAPLLFLALACSSDNDDTGPATDGGAADGGAADGGAADGGSTDGGATDGGAGDGGAEWIDPPGKEVASTAARETDPDVSEAELAQLAGDNAAFGLEMYQQLATKGSDNLFLSPHSISVALAMTYAGAEGTTESQMADALHFTLDEAVLHPAFNALDWELQSREELDPEVYEEGDGFRLSIVNQLFGQTGFEFEADYLDLLAVNYGAGMRLLDFASDPDGNRVLINGWVEEVTEDRIIDLLPAGSISEYTRLVLVNAIYFKASWMAPFEAKDTVVEDFTTLGGTTVSAETMHGGLLSLCGEGDGYALADVPYVGEELTMTLVVPEAGSFSTVEAALTGESLDAALATMTSCELTLALPKFSFRHAFNARDPLIALGMVDAFGDTADFSDVTTADQLHISGVYHQAFVALDEQGTEAAAATAVVEDGTGIPDPVSLTVDRPFIFLIRDRPTGAVLFLGRVADPTE